MKPGPRRLDVFFYGLFMDEPLLRATGFDPQNPRIAFVENFCLVIGARATLIPCPGGKVYGMLFSLTHAELESLYSEESVNAYRPEAINAQSDDGSTAPALCFNLPTPPASDERNPEYAAKLKQLAERLGFPKTYVSSIR